MSNNFGTALLLTTIAGLSTTIGGFLGFIMRKPSERFMSFVLGFSAGAMIMVSFVELLQESIKYIGFLHANLSFFAGFIIMFLIDYLIPHEYIGQHDFHQVQPNSELLRSGLLIAFGIGIHNFPEGIVTFTGTLQSVQLGITIAIAIAIHNIPEGMAISVPVYAATHSRKKAFLLSFLSGLAEPMGALIAGTILFQFWTPIVSSWVLGTVAGIMVFISLDELLPLSRSFGQEHLPILGLIVGMVVMVFSLWLLK